MVHIIIGGDHAGFYLKEKIIRWLQVHKHKVTDVGPQKYEKEDDYPDFSFPLAEKVAKEKNVYGIIIAGSGIGECIAANKVKGIRAVLYHGGSPQILKISKEHDNTNILCFGSRLVTEKEAEKAIHMWLSTSFTKATRHKRRLEKIAQYEKKK